MKEPAAKPTEHKCPACNGTGYRVVTQPAQPNRKIYPAPCKECGGKGRITEAASGCTGHYRVTNAISSRKRFTSLIQSNDLLHLNWM
jgi:DnaJ-class molecular chaperone